MEAREDVFTTVTAVGIARAPYDRVGFALSAEGRGKTGPESKEVLARTVAAIQTALNALRDGGADIPAADKIRKSNRTNAEYDYSGSGPRRLKGYTSTYTLSFVSKDLSRVSVIQDALTSLSGVQVGDPVFMLERDPGLQRIALEDAYAKVKARFAEQCAILEKDPDRYDIVNYNVDYGDKQRPERGVRMMAALAAHSMDGDSPPIEVSAGDEAVVTVTLEVSYKE